ncbi:MAG: matrixin family metalloprotease [Bdellovibrionota bacterium]
MTRKLLAITCLIASMFALQACGAKKSPEESCNFVQNGEQQRVSWGAQVPVVLYVDRSVPSVFYDNIVSAVAEWNTRVGREKIGGWAVNTNGQPAQDGQNVVYMMSTWEAEKANEQARTTVFWAGDRIYEADIRINDRNFDFSWGEPEVDKVDMQSLILHEFGHVMGLSHAVTPQSVMARSLPNATKRRELSTADQNSIRCEY